MLCNIEFTPTIFTYLSLSKFLLHISIMSLKQILKKFNVDESSKTVSLMMRNSYNVFLFGTNDVFVCWAGCSNPTNTQRTIMIYRI